MNDGDKILCYFCLQNHEGQRPLPIVYRVRSRVYPFRELVLEILTANGWETSYANEYFLRRGYQTAFKLTLPPPEENYVNKLDKKRKYDTIKVRKVDETRG